MQLLIKELHLQILLNKGDIAMTKNLPSLDFSRLTVGFEEMFRELESLSTHTTTYPPHNVVRYYKQSPDEARMIPTGKFAIELAVAGYSESDIDIEVAKNILDIKGKKPDSDTRNNTEEVRKYVHSGIAMRTFRRSFRLAEHIVVTGAKFENGLLIVELEERVPDEFKPRKIEIYR
jgi:molecular chaperone IbpA